jgi:thiamine-monophosphate kinase
VRTLSDIGEKEAVRRFTMQLKQRGDVITGPGDDCAIVRSPNDSVNDWLYTSDAVIEGRHFGADTAMNEVGHKALGRVLSDIAAMGGEPDWCLIDLVATGEETVEDMDALYRAIADRADEAGLSVVGGDLARGPCLELHVFAAGHLPQGTAIMRSGAQPGDILYVSGTLGGSIRGKHLTFEPRLREGQWLRERAWATAMIDVTDGLYSDLCQLSEMSGVGADIAAGAIPISAAATEAPTTPLQAALCDGEDYELLFTVPPGKQSEFETSWKSTFELTATPIGKITDIGNGIRVVDQNGDSIILDNQGYDHFAGNRNGQP